MSPSKAPILLALLAATAFLPAQSFLGPRNNIWVLDPGASQATPNPVLRILDPGGAELATVVPPGSSQARGLGFDLEGNAWVCRGDAVHKLDALGNVTGTTLSPPSGGNKSQDVIQLENGLMMVGWGATAGSSRIATYDRTTGAMVDSFSDALIDHPRRLVEVAPDLVVATSRGTDSLVYVDLVTSPPTVTTLADLSSQNVGPVGLTYDATRNAVWVVGDFGQSTVIGFVDLGTGSFTSVIDYATAGPQGFLAPSGLHFDDFRRIYVTCRNQNMATPGVYVFESDTGTNFNLLETFPSTATALASAIDVELQPADIETCGPFDPVAQQFVLVDNTVNMLKFSAPQSPLSVYAAALSIRWPQTCIPYVPGIIDPILQLAPTDPRGIPAVNDFLFRGSAGVIVPGACSLCGPGDVPLPALGVFISGFAGTLDAAGQATASVTLAINSPAIDGVGLSLAWLTIDSAAANPVRLIARPLCLTLRAGPLAVTPCP